MATLLKRRRKDPDGKDHKADAYVFGNAVGERLDSGRCRWPRSVSASRRSNGGPATSRRGSARKSPSRSGDDGRCRRRLLTSCRSLIQRLTRAASRQFRRDRAPRRLHQPRQVALTAFRGVDRCADEHIDTPWVRREGRFRQEFESAANSHRDNGHSGTHRNLEGAMLELLKTAVCLACACPRETPSAICHRGHRR